MSKKLVRAAERPIPFRGDMVRAVLAGTKTQTRRLVDGCVEQPGPYSDEAWGRGEMPWSPYAPGQRLWVRENYRFVDAGTHGGLRYDADGAILQVPAKPTETDDPHAWWDRGYLTHGEALRPNIFLPRWASRITLEVTGVRVERLQDISEDDAIAEGCPGEGCYRRPGFAGLVTDDGLLPDEQFGELWQSIHGKASWLANPYVWVISFRKVEG